MAAREVVTGRAKYARDIKQTRMLYGKILMSPYAHANITNIDASRAEALPGVRTVLTYKNAPEWMYGMPVPHIRVLDRKVRFVGDAVALVAADTEEIAEEALELIDVEYEPLPAVYEMEEAAKPGAPQLYKEFPGNIVPNKLLCESAHTVVEIDIGDTEKGFREADIIVEGSARVENAQNPLPAESPGIVADWQDGKVTATGSVQSEGRGELGLRSAMGLQQGDVRLVAAYLGGSFGSKNNVQKPGLHAAALSRAARRPVSLCSSKAEHFTAYHVRMKSRVSYKIGIKKDGTVTAITGEWLANAGAVSTLQGNMVSVGLEAYPMLARCSNVKVKTRLTLTNAVPSGPYRGFGILENSALLSMILFVAMEKANIDPVDYYKKNCIKEGDKFFHAYMGTGFVISAAPDIIAVTDKAAEVFRWKDRWKGWGKPTSVSGPKRRAVGIGVAGHADVGEQDSNAYVQLNAFGTVTVYSSASEFGAGTRDVVRKIAAEAMDVPLDLVKLTPPDSSVNPWEWGSTGARSTYAMGTAVLRAAEDAKKKLFQMAAPMLSANPEDLETRDGVVFVKGAGGKRLPWIGIMGWQNMVTGIGHFPARYNLPTYQVHFVELEVDTETGNIEMLDYLSAVDCGTIVNPLAFQGQLDGYFPGADLALREETVVDKATTRILNPNMVDYKWRLFNEIPPHRNVILESIPEKADPPCPFGARGGGEQSLASAGPAILMAIYNAIGKRFFEYPVTPDRILKALEKA